MSTIVVALGGNALGNNAVEQLKNAYIAAKSIVDLVQEGHNVVIAHGNGPQVGIIKQKMDEMPMPECTAMSQGYIGYHLSQSIINELGLRKISKKVSTVLSQVLVSKDDTAFQNPTKPIGSYYTKEEAEKLEAKTGSKYVEDSGRGYRLVVPSPKPVDIIEKDIVKMLVDAGVITIAVGGGGMPVVLKDGQLTGIDAVVDKDFSAAKLAELISADTLFILTAIDAVRINFNTPRERPLHKITAEEARKYIAEGHFAAGSMLPKVEAAVSFAGSGKGKRAIIASLQHASDAINGKSGTEIIYG